MEVCIAGAGSIGAVRGAKLAAVVGAAIELAQLAEIPVPATRVPGSA